VNESGSTGNTARADSQDTRAPAGPAAISVHAQWLTDLKEKLRPAKLRFTLPETQLFLLLAVIIGLFSGLLVVCFQISIESVRWWLLGSALAPSKLRVILMPTLGGLAVAFLVIKVFPRVRGSGVNQTKAAVYISDGYIPFSTVIGKFLTCALAIGSGHSLGPEDPSLQIGAGVASALGRQLRLSREKVRLIAPVGAAAGLAAAFNAPISAVLFVIEEVIGKWSAGVLGAIVLSAVASVVVERGLMGAAPLFRIPSYRLAHSSELLAYAVLGVIGGVSSVAFVRLIAYLRPRLRKLAAWTHYLQPAVAGLMIGVMGIWLPQVMGAGYQTIDQAINEQYAWRMLALLAVFKILATTLSFASGTPGGMFAPTLFIGAMIGGTVGDLEHHLVPSLTGSVGSYAVVGMGTLFAGFLRAPMTSVFMVLEVSGDYSIIVPVMISNTLAYLISRKYQETALFDLLSRQDGVDLPSMEDQREESPLLVEDAMRRDAAAALRGEQSVAEALQEIANSSDSWFLVNLGTREWGCVSKESLAHQADQGNGDLPLKNLPYDARLPHVHADQPLYVALRRIGDLPLLPVLSRRNPQKLEGVISLADILKAYHQPAPPDPRANSK
jgi:chloride channel protein, CIC family